MVGSEQMSELVGTNSCKTQVFHWRKEKQKRERKEGNKDGMRKE
jgi:hypothetical protein